jgi:hypothetical protein
VETYGLSHVFADVDPACWFVVKPPIETSPTTATGRASAKRSTTINIAISSPQSEKTNNHDLFHALDPSADQNIPNSIFENLKRDQNVEDEEEKIHIPREEQSELSARFKKYSMESSVRHRQFEFSCFLVLTKCIVTYTFTALRSFPSNAICP